MISKPTQLISICSTLNKEFHGIHTGDLHCLRGRSGLDVNRDSKLKARTKMKPSWPKSAGATTTRPRPRTTSQFQCWTVVHARQHDPGHNQWFQAPDQGEDHGPYKPSRPRTTSLSGLHCSWTSYNTLQVIGTVVITDKLQNKCMRTCCHVIIQV